MDGVGDNDGMSSARHGAIYKHRKKTGGGGGNRGHNKDHDDNRRNSHSHQNKMKIRTRSQSQSVASTTDHSNRSSYRSQRTFTNGGGGGGGGGGGPRSSSSARSAKVNKPPEDKMTFTIKLTWTGLDDCASWEERINMYLDVILSDLRRETGVTFFCR